MYPIYIYVYDDGETHLSLRSVGWGQDVRMNNRVDLINELISYGYLLGEIQIAIRAVLNNGSATL